MLGQREQKRREMLGLALLKLMSLLVKAETVRRQGFEKRLLVVYQRDEPMFWRAKRRTAWFEACPERDCLVWSKQLVVSCSEEELLAQNCVRKAKR